MKWFASFENMVLSARPAGVHPAGPERAHCVSSITDPLPSLIFTRGGFPTKSPNTSELAASTNYCGCEAKANLGVRPEGKSWVSWEQIEEEGIFLSCSRIQRLEDERRRSCLDDSRRNTEHGLLRWRRRRRRRWSGHCSGGATPGKPPVKPQTVLSISLKSKHILIYIQSQIQTHIQIQIQIYIQIQIQVQIHISRGENPPVKAPNCKYCPSQNCRATQENIRSVPFFTLAVSFQW